MCITITSPWPAAAPRFSSPWASAPPNNEGSAAGGTPDAAAGFGSTDTLDPPDGEVNIKIEEGNWSDISTKLMTSAVAGTLADVFWQPYFYIPYHIASGVMLPMDDLAAASAVDTSIWYPWALEMETFDGKLWGLPMGVMTGYNTLIYNREIIEAAGVPAPDGEKNTWAEYLIQESLNLY